MQRWKEIIRRFLLWIGAAALLLAMGACSKAPDAKPAAAQSGALMQKAAEHADVRPVDAPARLETRMQSDDGKVVVSANAPVTVLGCGTYPITRVNGIDFSQATVDRVIAVLLPDAELVNVRTERIKEDVQDSIDSKTAKRDRYVEMGILDIYERGMQRLADELAAAPESVPVVPYDGKLRAMTHDYGEYTAQYQGLYVGERAKELGFARYLRVTNNSDQTEPFRGTDEDGNLTDSAPVTRGAELSYFDNRLGQLFGAYREPRLWQGIRAVTGETIVDAMAQGRLSMTPAEAEQRVAALLDELDIPAVVNETWLKGEGEMDDDHRFVKAPTEFTYSVRCVSTLGGAPHVPCRTTSALNDETGEPAIQWTYEAVTVDVNDDGVMRLDWNSPHAVVETVVEAAQIMPFSEIQPIFEKILPLMLHREVDMLRLKKLHIEITQAYLGLLRATGDDDYSSAMLVPVWAFYGTKTYTNADGSVEHYDYGNAAPLIAVNAVDGSIIEVAEGY